jgi:hypothetical protein
MEYAGGCLSKTITAAQQRRVLHQRHTYKSSAPSLCRSGGARVHGLVGYMMLMICLHDVLPCRCTITTAMTTPSWTMTTQSWVGRTAHTCTNAGAAGAIA